jgi:hypothetical protein
MFNILFVYSSHKNQQLGYDKTYFHLHKLWQLQRDSITQKLN